MHSLASQGAVSPRPTKANSIRGEIQQALDACGKVQGVLLRANGTANAFLSGPLELRDGVTLIVDKGATLFASRDPAVYEKAPGSCGLVNESGSGCKPLISAQHVSARRWRAMA
jgi:polygalacturonase